MRQYISFIKSNFFRTILLVFAFIVPTISETEYLGGITATM